MNFAAAVRFVDRLLHRVRYFVRVQNDLGVDVSRGAANRLNQARGTSQKAFFVRIENGDQRNFWKIETLSKQVHPDAGVELAFSQFSQNFDTFDRVEFRVKPFAADAFFEHVSRQVFRQPLRQRGDQNSFAAFCTLPNLVHQVRNLAARRDDVNFRVDQASRTNDLLDDFAFGLFEFPVGRRRRHENPLPRPLVKLVKLKRPIIKSHRQAEAMFDQCCLTRVVAGPHGSNLRNRDVRLVDHQQRIFREEIEQRVRRLARFAVGECARIILDARTEARFPQ